MSDVLPCYAKRIFTGNVLCSQKEIKDYIQSEINYFKRSTQNNAGIIVISITEKDYMWEKWIKVLQTYPQVTFTRTRTKYHDGNYWCFLACIPCSPE